MTDLPNIQPDSRDATVLAAPDRMIKVREAFGIASDTAIPADYDGDGKTDFAVYRSGNWYFWRSSQGFSTNIFGNPNDVPAPADYDGDGKADIAIFRNGIWWILKSQTSTALGVSFGTSGDKAVSAAYFR